MDTKKLSLLSFGLGLLLLTQDKAMSQCSNTCGPEYRRYITMMKFYNDACGPTWPYCCVIYWYDPKTQTYCSSEKCCHVA